MYNLKLLINIYYYYYYYYIYNEYSAELHVTRHTRWYQSITSYDGYIGGF